MKRAGGRAAFGDPAAQCVLRVEIFFRGIGDCLGWSQADVLPVQTAIDRPTQDPGPFGLEPFRQSFVALLRRVRTEKGSMLNRRRIASSMLRKPGL